MTRTVGETVAMTVEVVVMGGMAGMVGIAPLLARCRRVLRSHLVETGDDAPARQGHMLGAMLQHQQPVVVAHATPLRAQPVLQEVGSVDVV
jgi:hypothetical protein